MSRAGKGWPREMHYCLRYEQSAEEPKRRIGHSMKAILKDPFWFEKTVSSLADMLSIILMAVCLFVIVFASIGSKSICVQ